MDFLRFIYQRIDGNTKKLAIPYYPIQSDNKGHQYNVSTYWEQLVAHYANISIFEIEEMNVIDYWQLRFDAFVYMVGKTEKGQEYLDNAYRISQTEPDRKALRKLKERGNTKWRIK